MYNNIPSDIPSNISGVRTRRPNTSRNPRINQHLVQLQTRKLEVIDNLVYEYNRNIRDYHQNIHDLINSIQNIQINQPTNALPNTNSYANPVLPITPELFSYFFYPLNSPSVNSPLVNSPLVNSPLVNIPMIKLI